MPPPTMQALVVPDYMVPPLLQDFCLSLHGLLLELWISSLDCGCALDQGLLVEEFALTSPGVPSRAALVAELGAASTCLEDTLHSLIWLQP